MDVFLVFSLCCSDWLELDLVMIPHSEVTSVSSSLQTSSLQPSSLPPAVLPPSSPPRRRLASGESQESLLRQESCLQPPLLASSPPSNPPRSLQTPPPGGPPPGGGLLHPDGLDQTSSLPSSHGRRETGSFLLPFEASSPAGRPQRLI